MPPPFAVTFDYRCPFARVVHDHLTTGLRAGAPWEVRFLPLSLTQLKERAWESSSDSGLLALEVAVAVRDGQPERFLDAHDALFDLRHAEGGDLRDAGRLTAALERAGVDAEAALAEVATGVPRKTVRAEHEWAVATHDVWGVPTVIAGGSAAFVRLMDRPADADDARRSVERLVDLLAGWPALNEFKHTTLTR